MTERTFEEQKTFEEQLAEKAQQAQSATGYMPLDQVPNEIKLKWISQEFKADKQGNECLFVIFEAEDQQKIRQKYTPTMLQDLLQDIKAIGSQEMLTKDFYLYRKKAVGKRGSFERLYPVSQETSKKKR